MWSLKAEIISRLQASFSQPNGDQVVDAPDVAVIEPDLGPVQARYSAQ
jgi:hypothetical protein